MCSNILTSCPQCQELNNSGATPDSFPALLRPTFPHYSGVHSRATPVHTPALLQSTTGLDRTPRDLDFDRTCAWPDMGSSCHSPVTYVPISRHLYLLVPSLFPAHIYFHPPISTSVVFASHWQWLSLGTYCPLSSFCHNPQPQPHPEATTAVATTPAPTHRQRRHYQTQSRPNMRSSIHSVDNDYNDQDP